MTTEPTESEKREAYILLHRLKNADIEKYVSLQLAYDDFDNKAVNRIHDYVHEIANQAHVDINSAIENYPIKDTAIIRAKRVKLPKTPININTIHPGDTGIVYFYGSSFENPTEKVVILKINDRLWRATEL